MYGDAREIIRPPGRSTGNKMYRADLIGASTEGVQEDSNLILDGPVHLEISAPSLARAREIAGNVVDVYYAVDEATVRPNTMSCRDFLRLSEAERENL